MIRSTLLYFLAVLLLWILYCTVYVTCLSEASFNERKNSSASNDDKAHRSNDYFY